MGQRRGGDPGDGGEEPDFITTGEAARLLGVSPRTVARWADQGRVVCIVTFGGHRRVSRGDVERLAHALRRRGWERSEPANG